VALRRHWELPPCRTQPAPACSKMDPPLPKAEPISKDGGSSVIKSLRMDKNSAVQELGERSEKV